jgi:transcriptional regulator with XRE-family HTH domain
MGSKVQQLPEYELLPEFLRQLREEAKLSQRAMGAAIDKPQSWVQYCETGSRRVDVAEFIQWAQVCNLTPEEALKRYLKIIEHLL